MSGNILLAIFLLPAFSFLFISLVLRPFLKNYPKWAGYVISLCLAAALVLSIIVLMNVNDGPITGAVDWATIGGLQITLGFFADNLTAMMLIVVCGVSFLVQIYSQGYMAGDPGYHRYFASMSLFTMSMLGLILADSILLMYVFWEGVGLGSYLLIGFWFHKPSAAAAAKKAFIVTRFGDFGFLIGILILYYATGTFDIHGEHGLNQLALGGFIGGTTLTLGALGLFSGAVGKSAQFPLHTWLPDAMEGPTPVSSLIHAATMVAAGVYLVARMLPLFASSEFAIMFVAVIGGITAIFAASMGLVMNDIKRVLAYSTMSQLGYMMLGLGAVGVGVYHTVHTGDAEAFQDGGHIDLTVRAAMWMGISVGIFHLFTHAFFKCLLFLGAGSLSHATGTFDMTLMGGMRKYQPWTFAMFVIGSLALAGIWPLAGFWSKDMIVLNAFEHTPILFWLAIITVFMTAFYMFRAIFMTFFGEYRGAEPAHGHGDDHGHHGEPHESPKVMLIPMAALCIMAVVCGWSLWGGGAKFITNEVWHHEGQEMGSLLLEVKDSEDEHVPIELVELMGYKTEEDVIDVELGEEKAIELAEHLSVEEIHELEEHGFHWHPHGFFALFTDVGKEPMPLIALIVALAGIGLAYAIYQKKWISAEALGQTFRPIHTLLSRKYYFDELYEKIFVIRILQNGINYVVELFDTYVVDGVVNGAGGLSMAIGKGLRKIETGQLQLYGLAIAAGVIIIIVVYLVVG